MSYIATRRFSDGLSARPYIGMGDAASASRTVGITGSMTASGITALLGSGLIGGAALVPIVGPILAGVTMGIQALVAQSGCGPTCVVTSQWANQAAAQLQQVMDGYFALPAPRTDSQKAVAVGAFQAVWQKLQQLCGQPGTGDAGVRCISDRQAGACTWRQKYAPTYPGQPNIGDCWNWFNGYLTPIQQDVTVPDTSITGTVDSVLSGNVSASSLLPYALIGALIWLGVSL